MNNPAPSDLLETLRNDRECHSLEFLARLDKMLAVASIALPAVYRAAANGNVVCKQAVVEIETELKK